MAGTTATGEDGKTVGRGDPLYAQAPQCFRKIEKALHEAGASFREPLPEWDAPISVHHYRRRTRKS